MAHKVFGDAQIMASYTLNSYFVTLSPWFEGDSMVVSFVKKGTKGKTNITIYTSLNKFEKLVKSIKDDSFLKTLKEDDKSDNPSAWVYKTGANASKQVTLGLGSINTKTNKRSICIHGYDANKPVKDRNANVPITWEDLKDMVWAYELITSPKPTDNCWHAMLWQAFWDAYKEKAKHYVMQDDDEEYCDENEQEMTADVNETENAPSAQDKPKSKTSEGVVTLRGYKKEGDVVSFDGTYDGEEAVFRIESSEFAGKDKATWNKASSDMKKKGNIDLRLKLRHVRNNEYTILGIA